MADTTVFGTGPEDNWNVISRGLAFRWSESTVKPSQGGGLVRWNSLKWYQNVIFYVCMKFNKKMQDISAGISIFYIAYIRSLSVIWCQSLQDQLKPRLVQLELRKRGLINGKYAWLNNSKPHYKLGDNFFSMSRVSCPYRVLSNYTTSTGKSNLVRRSL
jgi:hypothetical protein